jgi:hypothetical protein
MGSNWLFLLLALMAGVQPVGAAGFVFRELLVSASSLVTNVTTTYTVAYEHYRTQTFGTTAWNNVTLTPTDTATLTFPNEYVLTSNITCRYSVNSTGIYTTTGCGLVGNVITLSGIFNNVLVQTLTVVVANVSNPYPAGTTSIFSGSIGPDTSYTLNSATTANSKVTISPAQSSCSFTFAPNSVYTSPTNLVMTLTTVNQFPAAGAILVQFPFSKVWSQDLVPTRTMPITTGAMVCTNQSAVPLPLART